MKQTYCRKEGNSLTSVITSAVRKKILIGEYPAGEKIKEINLCKEFNVSRTPIRDVFRNLEREGLIKHIPNRGCYAVGMRYKDIEDLFEIRIALECMIVEKAIYLMKKDMVNRLIYTNDRAYDFACRGDYPKVLELDKDFHSIIYEAAGSRMLAQSISMHSEYMDTIRKTDFYSRDFGLEVVAEHKLIIDALIRKDCDQCKSAVIHHLEKSLERVKTVYVMGSEEARSETKGTKTA
jgi:DNA-binding GntR family transcriptional regulator